MLTMVLSHRITDYFLFLHYTFYVSNWGEKTAAIKERKKWDAWVLTPIRPLGCPVTVHPRPSLSLTSPGYQGGNTG